MTKSNILFIGMDVQKESIEIAIAEDGANGEVRRFGCIGGSLDALKKTAVFVSNVVVVAIARELAGFMWAIAQAVPLSKPPQA